MRARGLLTLRNALFMRILLLIAGSALLVLGMISLVTPLPGSSLFIATGGGLMVRASKTVERFIRNCRIRLPRFNRGITWVEDRMGERISAGLRRTRPNESN